MPASVELLVGAGVGCSAAAHNGGVLGSTPRPTTSKRLALRWRQGRFRSRGSEGAGRDLENGQADRPPRGDDLIPVVERRTPPATDPRMCASNSSSFTTESLRPSPARMYRPTYGKATCSPSHFSVASRHAGAPPLPAARPQSGSDGDRGVQQSNAYNPSCAYDDRWACPLAPPENRLTEPIRAGELAYHG
jgi:hypothetical protein